MHIHKVGTTKEKSKFKCHVFKAQRSMDYFVTELDGKALCLKHSDTVATLKDYYIHENYHTKHSPQ